MVCLGNICRSPLAEGILAHKALENGVTIKVDSAGTAAYHVGEKPDPRSIQIAKKHGIDISKQKARKFTQEDFNNFDIIYAMDVSNFNKINALAINSEQKLKVKLILNEINPNSNSSVPDPYYGGDNGFEDVFNMLDIACDKIINKINE